MTTYILRLPGIAITDQLSRDLKTLGGQGVLTRIEGLPLFSFREKIAPDVMVRVMRNIEVQFARPIPMQLLAEREGQFGFFVIYERKAETK